MVHIAGLHEVRVDSVSSLLEVCSFLYKLPLVYAVLPKTGVWLAHQLVEHINIKTLIPKSDICHFKNRNPIKQLRVDSLVCQIHENLFSFNCVSVFFRQMPLYIIITIIE